MDRKQPVKSHEPIKVDPKATEIEMNGRTYRRASSISIARYPFLEMYKATWIYGRQAHELHKEHKELEVLMNKVQFVDAAVRIHNLANSIAGMTDMKRLPAAACITMLFWNYEGEDVGTMSTELMNEKLDDATKSGIDKDFFFSQALALLLLSAGSSDQTNPLDVGSPKQVTTPIQNPVS